MTIAVNSPLDRLLVEHAVLMAQEIRKHTFAAKSGHVLDACETMALSQGREFIRLAVETAAQEWVDEFEKKVGRPEPARAAAGVATKAPTPKKRLPW
jgi:hypothetical protein